MSVWDRLFAQLFRRPTRPPVRPPEPPELPPPPPEPTPEPPPPVAPEDPPGNDGGGGRVIKVTDERDGDLINRMYSYWSSAAVINGAIYAFVGHRDNQPRFFKVELNGDITRLGALLPYRGTGEGWYFTAAGDICLCDGPRLHRVNPFTGEDLILLDISERYPGHDIWQAHSSDDGQTHSATIRRIVSDGPFPKIGTIVQHHGAQSFYGAEGGLDESIVTADGGFLIIQDSHNNHIHNLNGGPSWTLLDADRAVAHCDVGPGYVVGEADKPDPGACVLWNLPSRTMRILFHTIGMGHVSVRAGRCLQSDDTHLRLVGLDGAGVTHLGAHGMVGNPREYDYQCHANLSPCGRVAAWVSNAAGRFDLYIRVM